jgi:exonuclease VII small subunit
MSHIQALENEIAALKEEFEKFERGNKSAGTRARKVLQNIKRISQEIRIQIQTAKKTENKA